MADTRIVAGSAGRGNGGDGEGEGEGGERGERGHRGHRGPRGHRGRDANAVPTAAFAVKTTTIYARLGGSDEHGKGTLDNPFATFQQAIRFVPNIIPPGETFVVDITGIGVETLPTDYQLPSIQGTYAGGAESPNPFLFDRPLTIRAFPQLVVTSPATEAIITPGSGFTRGVGPNALLIDITVPGVRSSWAGGAMKGKQLIRTGGGGPAQLGQTTCAIYDSVDDDGFGNAVLRVCQRIAFIVDAATLSAGPTPGEYQIVEPSATLEGPPPTLFDGVVFNVANVANLAIQGLRIRCTVPGAAFAGLQVLNATQNFCELCDLPDGAYSSGVTLQMAFFSTVFGAGGVTVEGSQLSLRRSYLRGAQIFGCDGGFNNDCFNTVWEDCVPIQNVAWPAGPAPMDIGLSNCLIDGAITDPNSGLSDAIHLSKGRLNLLDVTIKNTVAGDAINLQDGSYAIIDHVTGSANGTPGVNVGIRTDDGSEARITNTTGGPDLTTVTGGAAGDDVKSGSLAITSYAAALNEYDIPPTSAIAVATGSRIFERT